MTRHATTPDDEHGTTRCDGCRELGHVKRIEQLEAALAKVLRILTSDGAPIPETRNKAAVYAARKALARDVEKGEVSALNDPVELPSPPALCSTPSPWPIWGPCLRALGHDGRHAANGRAWGAE